VNQNIIKPIFRLSKKLKNAAKPKTVLQHSKNLQHNNHPQYCAYYWKPDSNEYMFEQPKLNMPTENLIHERLKMCAQIYDCNKKIQF